MLDWLKFEQLPGGAQLNFELLCRSIVRLRYSTFGEFAELKNQPGVEFHLRLTQDCDSLGKSSQWFGWQCKWFAVKRDGSLTGSQKKQIEDSLKKTKTALPKLTDWVLCTREQLSKSDKVWFKGLQKKHTFPKRLHLWNSMDMEARLIGEAELLRQAYFGDLILTSDHLNQLHEKAVAPIRRRWMPECHQTVEAERAIRRMLGEHCAWDELIQVAGDLVMCISEINKEGFAPDDPLYVVWNSFVEASHVIAARLRECHEVLAEGDFEALRLLLDLPMPAIRVNDIASLPQKMRNRRLLRQVFATNAFDDMQQAFRLMEEIKNSVRETMVAVVAEAGGGKTQLAAQLTASDAITSRPAGLFFHGRDLSHGQDLNTFAAKVTIQGRPVQSMEALLTALDVAGQRAHRRLPLVIDGLNEAQDPRDWKPLLSQLNTLLKRYPFVLGICTVRSGRRGDNNWRGLREDKLSTSWLDFAQQTLPDDIRRLEIPDFGLDADEAMLKYFEHYRIRAEDDISLPSGFLRHPLTLRIFCEITNKGRKKEVVIDSIPMVMDDLLEEYAKQASERISELASKTHRFCQGDVLTAIYTLGQMLWDKMAREIDEGEFRRELNDDTCPWTGCLVQLMEQEGLILRVPGETPARHGIIPVYDRFGGHLIATALLAQAKSFDLKKWIKSSKTTAKLSWGHDGSHPLAYDTFISLVNQIPKKRHGMQFWQMTDQLAADALLKVSQLGKERLDRQTVDKIAEVIAKNYKDYSSHFLAILFHARGIPGHPLNADFLDSVLRKMPMVERDLLWTEWIRHNSSAWETQRVVHLYADINKLEEHWRKNVKHRTESDTLRAKWLSWMLTTTIRDLRNRVTRALYWFGRGNAQALFGMTVCSMEINDPYVFERLMAASYGTAMALASQPEQQEFRGKVLPAAARIFFNLMFAKDAPRRTTHSQIREFARRFIELAQYHNSNLFNEHELRLANLPYASGGQIEWPAVNLKHGKPRGSDSPFRMDFENYTIGRLVEGCRNYDYSNPKYMVVREQILWRIKGLGWSHGTFGEIDNNIEQRNPYTRSGGYPGRVDRYGKKYSWVAYFEMKGFLESKDFKTTKRCDYEWRRELDIDPSFPEPPRKCRVITTNLLERDSVIIQRLKPYFRMKDVDDLAGPWVLLDGYIEQDSADLNRDTFAFIQSFLVPSKYVDTLKALSSKHKCSIVGQLRNGMNTFSETHMVCAGEMPWCSIIPYREKTSFAVSPQTPEIPAEDLVMGMLWEGERLEDKNIDAKVLRKKLAQSLRLVNIPQSFDLQTLDGKQATLNTHYTDDIRRNTEHLLFMNKELLEALLRKRRMSMVWIVFGENSCSREMFRKNIRPESPLEWSEFNELILY